MTAGLEFLTSCRARVMSDVKFWDRIGLGTHLINSLAVHNSDGL